MPTPDTDKIELYLMSRANNYFFGRYKSGPEHFFVLNKNDDGWDIVPEGSKRWDMLDQQAWFGHDVDEWYGKGSTHITPDWLPEIPSKEELEKVKSIKWEDNFENKPYPANKFPVLKKYFDDNQLTSVKIYFVLYEDVYESQLGDGIFRYLCMVSFDANEIIEYISSLRNDNPNAFELKDFIKEHTVEYQENKFSIPDFKLDLFEHYEVAKLLDMANNSSAARTKQYEKDYIEQYAIDKEGRLIKL